MNSGSLLAPSQLRKIFWSASFDEDEVEDDVSDSHWSNNLNALDEVVVDATVSPAVAAVAAEDVSSSVVANRITSSSILRNTSSVSMLTIETPVVELLLMMLLFLEGESSDEGEEGVFEGDRVALLLLLLLLTLFDDIREATNNKMVFSLKRFKEKSVPTLYKREINSSSGSEEMRELLKIVANVMLDVDEKRIKKLFAPKLAVEKK